MEPNLFICNLKIDISAETFFLYIYSLFIDTETHNSLYFSICLLNTFI